MGITSKFSLVSLVQCLLCYLQMETWNVRTQKLVTLCIAEDLNLPEATSELVFLQGIYAEEERKVSYRERMAKGNFHKFITYMMKSCLISRRNKQECYEFLHNLDSFCEWISYDEDDSDESDLEDL